MSETNTSAVGILVDLLEQEHITPWDIAAELCKRHADRPLNLVHVPGRTRQKLDTLGIHTVGDAWSILGDPDGEYDFCRLPGVGSLTHSRLKDALYETCGATGATVRGKPECWLTEDELE